VDNEPPVPHLPLALKQNDLLDMILFAQKITPSVLQQNCAVLLLCEVHEQKRNRDSRADKGQLITND
jgi:hypothetical protein